MNKKGAILVVLILIVLLLPIGASSISGQNTRTPIKHVINIYFENHTFDNYFGTYPQSPQSSKQGIISSLPTPVNLLNNVSLLSSVRAIPAGNFSTPDPIEGYTAYHTDWNHGSMNNFLNGSGPYSMTYYNSSQLGPIWDLAEQYSMGDMYFSPVISESAPNTMYYLAGFSPVFNDYGPPPGIPFSQTIFGELSSYNVSWGLYIPKQSLASNYSEWNHIEGMNSYLGNVGTWDDFSSELENGTIPSVSYVFSQEANGTDQAAPSNILKGEMWLIYLVNKIEESPIWNSTAIFITWDDPGGYYDQVSPPVVDGMQLGFRLPFIVISPFAKEGYISNTILTHSSILAFIDYNWEMPALNQFVSRVNIPIDFFNFNDSYGQNGVLREPIIFNFGNSFPVPKAPEFTLPTNLQSLNISATFPMEPQYNLSSLPYPKTGSVIFNLSSISPQVFVKQNSVLVPFYASYSFLFAFILLDVIVLSFGVRQRWKK
jgi:phospholipase C